MLVGVERFHREGSLKGASIFQVVRVESLLESCHANILPFPFSLYYSSSLKAGAITIHRDDAHITKNEV